MKNEKIRVKIMFLGRGVEEFISDGPCTIEQALNAFEISSPSADIRLNGKPASSATLLKYGDMVAVIPKIQGG